MPTLILCCAGSSTRFPNHRPKWSLTHPDGEMMAVASIAEMRGFDRLVVAVRRGHAELYGKELIYQEFDMADYGDAEIVVIDPTSSQVETVRRVLEVAKVGGPFTVKDCDNVFGMDVPSECAVALADLHCVERITPGNKSYARVEEGLIREVKEKRIISHLFCCGAYSFVGPQTFHAGLDQSTPPQFLSQVIDHLVRNGVPFKPIFVDAPYVDWGTEQDWQVFLRDYCTLFVDVDGVLCKSSHRSFKPAWGESELIDANVDALNRLAATGKVEIILTTSRDEAGRFATERQLKRLNYSRLIMGLQGGRRVLINDVVSRRGVATASAINIERNSPELEALLRTYG